MLASASEDIEDNLPGGWAVPPRVAVGGELDARRSLGEGTQGGGPLSPLPPPVRFQVAASQPRPSFDLGLCPLHRDAGVILLSVKADPAQDAPLKRQAVRPFTPRRRREAVAATIRLEPEAHQTEPRELGGGAVLPTPRAS